MRIVEPPAGAVDELVKWYCPRCGSKWLVSTSRPPEGFVVQTPCSGPRCRGEVATMQWVAVQR